MLGGRAIAILGAGGHALSVAETAHSAGYVVHFFVDPDSPGRHLLGIPVVAEVPPEFLASEGCFAVAVGDNAVRQHVVEAFQTRFTRAVFPALIHESASVSTYARIGEGSVVLQGAIVGSASEVGAFCILNSGAVLDHASRMGTYSSLAPRAVAGGNVTIGVRSAISIGATIRHATSIGNDTVVGANSYVNKDLPSLVVAYGSPARLVRERRVGDPYLS